MNFKANAVHALLALLLAITARAEDSATPSMSDAVTCAAYYRMLAGSMSAYGKNLSTLADIEKDKMFTLLDVAKSSAGREFGKANAEAKVDTAWQAAVKDMMKQINSNYDNVTLLRVRYNTRCKAMLKAVNPG